jgi:hypothetical protein
MTKILMPLEGQQQLSSRSTYASTTVVVPVRFYENNMEIGEPASRRPEAGELPSPSLTLALS